MEVMETQSDFCCFPQKPGQKPLELDPVTGLFQAVSVENGGVWALRNGVVLWGTGHALSSEILWGTLENPTEADYE